MGWGLTSQQKPQGVTTLPPRSARSRTLERGADRLRERFSAPGIEPSGASVLTTSYGMDGRENILPFMMSNSYQAYGQNAIVFGAMLARLMLFSEATFAYRDLSDGSLSGAFETDGRRNTGLAKLEDPWPNGTTGELLARMIQDTDLAGNAYIWDAGEQLVRLRPDWITIVSELVPDPLGRVYRKPVGYWFEPPKSVLDAGPPTMFLPDEVAHWSPIPDPWATFRGMSWLTPVLREIAADQGMTTYKIRYLENAASPNLLIKYAQNIGDETLTRIQTQLEDRHGGSDNAFKTLVLDEGADAMIIGNTFEQMNFSTVQAAGENRIIIASGVPGIVIGAKEGLMAATYSNYEQAMRRFADLTMRPLWRMVCGCLSKLVPVPSGKRLWFNTADIAALRQGEKERADTVLVKAQAAKTLIEASFTADTVVAAVEAGELTNLKWEAPKPPPAAPPPPAQANGQGTPSNGQKAPELVSAGAARSEVERFNPRQPRDAQGQWTGHGGMGGSGIVSVGGSGSGGGSVPALAGDHSPLKPGATDSNGEAFGPDVVAAANGVHAQAIKQAEPITRDMLANCPDGARMTGLPFRVKTPESLAVKIRIAKQADGTAPATAAGDIFDSVRFTQTSSPDRLAADANASLDRLRRQSYTVTKISNTWQNTDDNPYQGVNVKLLHPSGHQVELQFHTPESFATKERLHVLYNQQKLTTPGSPEWTALNDEMLADSQGLEVPADVHSIR